MADAEFSSVDGMRYTPYGLSRDAGSNLHTDHRFTGQILDESVGLYWYASRAYDPALGRFTCPDTIVPEPGNPQALNRYAYCGNSPLGRVDPSGHDYSDFNWSYDHGRGGFYNDAGERWVSLGDESQAALDGQMLWDQDEATQGLFLATWGSEHAATHWSYEHNFALCRAATVGTDAERDVLAAALAAMGESGSAEGIETARYFWSGRGTVRFSGHPFRMAGCSIGVDDVVYLEPETMKWAVEALAAHIAHESVHAQVDYLRYPFTIEEEVRAFTRQVAVWEGFASRPQWAYMGDYVTAAGSVSPGEAIADVVKREETYKGWVYRIGEALSGRDAFYSLTTARRGAVPPSLWPTPWR